MAATKSVVIVAVVFIVLQRYQCGHDNMNTPTQDVLDCFWRLANSSGGDFNLPPFRVIQGLIEKKHTGANLSGNTIAQMRSAEQTHGITVVAGASALVFAPHISVHLLERRRVSQKSGSK